MSGTATTQLLVPRLIVKRPVEAVVNRRLVSGRFVSGRLVVAQLVVAHALKARVGKTRVRTLAGRTRSVKSPARGPRVPGMRGTTEVGNLVARHRGRGRRVAGPSESRRTGWRPGSGSGTERGIGGRGLRAVIGGIRVAGIAVASVVYSRLPIDGSGVVPGLEHVPGRLVKLTETLRPGNLGTERHLAPSAGANAGVASWPRARLDWTARCLIRVRTLHGWPSAAIWSQRTTPHIPGHSPVCRTAGQ